MRFEYQFVRLVDDFNGQQAVVDRLNQLGAEGWELVGGTGVLAGGWGVMKRAVVVVGSVPGNPDPGIMLCHGKAA